MSVRVKWLRVNMNFAETNREAEFIGSGRDPIPMFPFWQRFGSMHMISNKVGEAERDRGLRLNKLNPNMLGGGSWQGDTALFGG